MLVLDESDARPEVLPGNQIDKSPEHLPNASFDPLAGPSLARRMKFQALIMAGVSLLFLVATLCIGFVIPIIERLLQ